ncbi:hypothetical protein COLO4_09308 [Corchorus olitorius]|uniref:Transposase, Tc1-like protein n=1 Tax=Corchorus olitorius TaxID=93759 RepID=A0A1R3KCM2_9ROSI|nr:hypothetical protein COLO4_09308 [Corchorus olitorius]
MASDDIAATTIGIDLNAIPPNLPLVDDEPDENEPLPFHEEEVALHQEIYDDSENESLLSEEEDEISNQATYDGDLGEDEIPNQATYDDDSARPRFNAQGNVIFSGKIGVFPLVTKEPARRSSVNRVSGTLETKPIQSIRRDVIKKVLLEQVLPAIRAKWPREDSRKPIFIQQDNARTHVRPNDADFLEAAKEDGFDIQLRNQPANSPDLNVLDLGFFNAMQALQHQEAPTMIDELINAVIKSFYDYPPKKSNRIFITLQSSMVEIMRAQGCNNYDIPHLGKQRLERQGKLPIRLKCDAELEQEVAYYLGIRRRPPIPS